MKAKKNSYWIVAIALVFMIGVYLILTSIFEHFDTIEGRSWEKHANVKWIIENGHQMHGFSDYLLLQKHDHITDQPDLTVTAKFWNDQTKYLEFWSITREDYKGTSCMSPNKIGKYHPICRITNYGTFTPCLNPFFVKQRITGETTTLSEVAEKYDAVEAYISKWPDTEVTATKYSPNGQIFPTFQNEVDLYRKTGRSIDLYEPNMPRRCWVEILEPIPEAPKAFACDNNYSTCLTNTTK